MNEPSRPIVEQAALRFAQSRNETIAQRQAREAWLAEDAEHARAYEEARRMWDRMGDFQDDPLWQARTAARLASFERAHRTRRRGRLLAAAAILVLLLSGAYLVVRFTAAARPLNYATRVGERRTEILRDGTRYRRPRAGSAITRPRLDVASIRSR
jgi:transmembrane sensor